LPGRGVARAGRAAAFDLERAGAARAARPAGSDRQATGRGASALEAFLDAGGAAVGRDRRAELLAARARRGAAPLLARPHMDQQRLAGLARPGSAGLSRGGDRARAGGRRRSSAQRPARVLRPPRWSRDGSEELRLVGARGGAQRAAGGRAREPSGRTLAVSRRPGAQPIGERRSAAPSSEARPALVVALEPIVGYRLPRGGVGDVGAPARPHAGVPVERAHAHAHLIVVLGVAAEQVGAALAAEALLEPAIAEAPSLHELLTLQHTKGAPIDPRLRRRGAPCAALA